MKALSIMQPWAWLIVNGHKDIENRTWPTKYRGPILIHAGKTVDSDCADELRGGCHPVTGRRQSGFSIPLRWETGGIVGEAEIADCITASDSPWFVGRYGFVLRNARPLPFRPLRGKLGLFDVK
jgi:hypothetical protein